MEEMTRMREETLQRITALEAEQRTQGREIGELKKTYRQLSDINENLARMIVLMEQHQKQLDEQEERLDSLEDAPKQYWGIVVKTVITLLIGAAFGVFFRQS
jgi:DNA repair ATPase RecN